MGIPVVAPNFGPFQYLVKDRTNGLLYQPDSIERLADTIDEALDDRTLYARLQVGAAQTGRELSGAQVNFFDAIKSAFEYIEHERTHPQRAA
jgi:glycosyltransferase involved in cell wall biosynthesis